MAFNGKKFQNSKLLNRIGSTTIGDATSERDCSLHHLNRSVQRSASILEIKLAASKPSSPENVGNGREDHVVDLSTPAFVAQLQDSRNGRVINHTVQRMAKPSPEGRRVFAVKE